MIKKIKTATLFIIFLQLIFVCKANAQHTAKFICKNFPDQKVYLKLIRGGSLKLIDSAYLKNQLLQFEFKNTAPNGLYLIKLNDSLFLDFFYHQEDIIIELNGHVLPTNIKVIQSDENKIYFTYLVFENLYKKQVDSLYEISESFLNPNRPNNTSKLDSLKKQLKILENKKNEFVKNLISNNSEKKITKIIKALQWPDYEEYIKTSGDSLIAEYDFYKKHFFDNINFNDTILINTPVLFEATYTYLKEFVDTPTVKNYCNAIDFILQKASINETIKHYLTNLLISSFRQTKNLEDVATYIVNEYLLPQHIKDKSLREKIINETLIKKELLPGDTAPNIILPTTNGKILQLHDVKAKAILVVFWAPDCEHCIKTLPSLKKIYSKFHKKGLEIFMVSIDLSYKLWVRAIQNFEIDKWIHVSDNKGMENPYIYLYHLKRTPAFFVLNENKIIFSIPAKAKEINKDIKTLLGK